MVPLVSCFNHFQNPINQTTMAEVLKNTKATALVSASHKIISVKSSDNVPKVFETLVKNKILSAPVQDDDGKVRLWHCLRWIFFS